MVMIPLLLLSFAAAFFGTVAMTVSQEIEIRINKRPISYTPALAVFRILHLDFDRLSTRMKGVASYAVHFAYGTVWGFPLAFMNFASIWLTILTFWIIVVIQGWIILPILGIAGPFWTWGLKAVITEMIHKFIYAVTTVLFFVGIFVLYFGFIFRSTLNDL